MKQTFTDLSFTMCLTHVTKFIQGYNLELVSLTMKKKKVGNNEYYEAIVEYKLGLER